jgi:hypothetical protein
MAGRPTQSAPHVQYTHARPQTQVLGDLLCRRMTSDVELVHAMEFVGGE